VVGNSDLAAWHGIGFDRQTNGESMDRMATSFWLGEECWSTGWVALSAEHLLGTIRWMISWNGDNRDFAF
jgi:hypothetical protein